MIEAHGTPFYGLRERDRNVVEANWAVNGNLGPSHATSAHFSRLLPTFKPILYGDKSTGDCRTVMLTCLPSGTAASLLCSSAPASVYHSVSSSPYSSSSVAHGLHSLVSDSVPEGHGKSATT